MSGDGGDKGRVSWFALAVVAGVIAWQVNHAYVYLGVIVVGIIYVCVCARFPLVKCKRCDGKGILPAWFGGGHRECPRCGRKREHVRWGRRVWDKRASGDG